MSSLFSHMLHSYMHLVPFSSLCYTNLTEPRQFLRLFLDLSPIVRPVTRQYMEIHGITGYDSFIFQPWTAQGDLGWFVDGF